LEAYLNHIGLGKFPWWSVVERKLSPSEKLVLIESLLRIPIDRGILPFQSFGTLMSFRNTVVHGKTEELSKVYYHTDPQRAHSWELELPWEELCRQEKSNALYEDTTEMIKIIHKHLYPNDDPFQAASLSKRTVGLAPKS